MKGIQIAIISNAFIFHLLSHTCSRDYARSMHRRSRMYIPSKYRLLYRTDSTHNYVRGNTVSPFVVCREYHSPLGLSI